MELVLPLAALLLAKLKLIVALLKTVLRLCQGALQLVYLVSQPQVRLLEFLYALVALLDKDFQFRTDLEQFISLLRSLLELFSQRAVLTFQLLDDSVSLFDKRFHLTDFRLKTCDLLFLVFDLLSLVRCRLQQPVKLVFEILGAGL